MRYRIPIGTIRDWEQGRIEPDQLHVPTFPTFPRLCPSRLGSEIHGSVENTLKNRSVPVAARIGML